MSWGSDDYSSPRPAGRWFKIEEGESITISLLSDCVTRFRPKYGLEGEPDYYTGPVPGKSEQKYLFDLFNLGEGIAQVWETSANNQRMINAEIAEALKEGAKSYDRVKLKIKKAKSANGFIQYTIMQIGELPEQKYAEAGQAYNATDMHASSVDGVMTLDEAKALVGAGKLDPSPPASSAAVDEDIPF